MRSSKLRRVNISEFKKCLLGTPISESASESSGNYCKSLISSSFKSPAAGSKCQFLADVGQATTSDNQTLQALLKEVRDLRQDLRASLSRTQTMQILLVRFQMQEGAIARASDRTNSARQRLLDTHVQQKELTAAMKQLEDLLDSAQNPQQQAEMQDRLKHIESDLQIAADLAQQRQAEETQAEQQLRNEQEKLIALESQLDELTRGLDRPAEQSSRTK